MCNFFFFLHYGREILSIASHPQTPPKRHATSAAGNRVRHTSYPFISFPPNQNPQGANKHRSIRHSKSTKMRVLRTPLEEEYTRNESEEVRSKGESQWAWMQCVCGRIPIEERRRFEASDRWRLWQRNTTPATGASESTFSEQKREKVHKTMSWCRRRLWHHTIKHNNSHTKEKEFFFFLFKRIVIIIIQIMWRMIRQADLRQALPQIL